jgi:hypothetical protein
MDMPAEEGPGSAPFLRHAYGRIIFNMFQLMPGFATAESPEKGTEVAPPRPATR